MTEPTTELIELADSFKQTRVYQEAKEEGRLEGLAFYKLEKNGSWNVCLNC